MTEHNEEFSKILREILERRGVKQSWITEMMGLDKSCINKWVHGKTAPNYSSLIELAKVLGVNPGDFFPPARKKRKSA